MVIVFVIVTALWPLKCSIRQNRGSKGVLKISNKSYLISDRRLPMNNLKPASKPIEEEVEFDGYSGNPTEHQISRNRREALLDSINKIVRKLSDRVDNFKKGFGEKMNEIHSKIGTTTSAILTRLNAQIAQVNKLNP